MAISGEKTLKIPIHNVQNVKSVLNEHKISSIFIEISSSFKNCMFSPLRISPPKSYVLFSSCRTRAACVRFRSMGCSNIMVPTFSDCQISLTFPICFFHFSSTFCQQIPRNKLFFSVNAAFTHRNVLIYHSVHKLINVKLHNKSRYAKHKNICGQKAD